MIAKLYTSPFWVPLPCWPLPARRSSGAVHIKPKGATVRWADENLLRVAHLVYFALKIWNRKVLVRKMAGTMSCVQGQRHFSLAVSLWPWSVKEHIYQHIVRFFIFEKTCSRPNHQSRWECSPNGNFRPRWPEKNWKFLSDIRSGEEINLTRITTLPDTRAKRRTSSLILFTNISLPFWNWGKNILSIDMVLVQYYLSVGYRPRRCNKPQAKECMN